MGLAWQQGPLASGAIGRLLVPDPLSLDGTWLRLEPGQTVVPHGPDRELTPDDLSPGRPS